METLSISFEREVYRAVARIKRECPGLLEARTKARNERKEREYGKRICGDLPEGSAEIAG